MKKIRIIPQRKLKDTYSQQSAIYVQAGVEYIKHVSSLVKSKINALGISSFSCEGLLFLTFYPKNLVKVDILCYSFL